jgi:hypothetical protein
MLRDLREDAPDGGFEQRLQAALVAESAAVLRRAVWARWLKRVGVGVAIASVPVAAAAAVGSGWVDMLWTRGNAVETQVDEPKDFPPRKIDSSTAQRAAAPKVPPTTAPPPAASPQPEEPRPLGSWRAGSRAKARVATRAAPEPLAVHDRPSDPGSEAEAVPRQTPAERRVERVRLSPRQGTDDRGTSRPDSPGSVRNPAAATAAVGPTHEPEPRPEPSAQSPSSSSNRLERRRARERRQQAGATIRERRQTGSKRAR